MESDFDLYSFVRESLHTKWDPIGVSQLTCEMGEYDSYVLGLCSFLEHHPSPVELYNYLWEIETVSMGMSGSAERTRSFSEWIFLQINNKLKQ